MAFQSNIVPLANAKPYSRRNGNRSPAAPGEKKDLPTPEFIFSKEMLNTLDGKEFALRSTKPKPMVENNALVEYEEGTVYMWDGRVWRGMSFNQQVGVAQNWLASKMPSKYKKQTAKSMAETAIVHLANNQRIFYPLRETCIATLNGYFHLVADPDMGESRWCVREPNKDCGMMALVPATIDTDRIDSNGFYTPAPLKPGSKFKSYLDLIMPDLAVRGVLQEAVASSFMPHISFERAFWLYGEGSNGKSTLLNLLETLHGPGYASGDIPMLGSEFGLADLLGKSCVGIPEATVTDWDTTRIKQIVSHDPMGVNRKHQAYLTARMTCTLFIAMNELPYIKDSSHGFKRKQVVIPFNRKISAGESIPDFYTTLTQDPQEMACVLDWILEGAMRLAKRGRFLSEEELPLACREPLLEVEQATDHVQRYLDEHEASFECPTVMLNKKQFYAIFCEWIARQNVRNVPAESQFWMRMRKLAKKVNVENFETRPNFGGARVQMVHLNANPSLFKHYGIELDSRVLPAPVPAGPVQYDDGPIPF